MAQTASRSQTGKQVYHCDIPGGGVVLCRSHKRHSHQVTLLLWSINAQLRRATAREAQGNKPCQNELPFRWKSLGKFKDTNLINAATTAWLVVNRSPSYTPSSRCPSCATALTSKPSSRRNSRQLFRTFPSVFPQVHADRQRMCVGKVPLLFEPK